MLHDVELVSLRMGVVALIWQVCSYLDLSDVVSHLNNMTCYSLCSWGLILGDLLGEVAVVWGF